MTFRKQNEGGVGGCDLYLSLKWPTARIRSNLTSYDLIILLLTSHVLGLYFMYFKSWIHVLIHVFTSVSTIMSVLSFL